MIKEHFEEMYIGLGKIKASNKYYDWILRNGKTFTKVNKEWSEAMAITKKSKVKSCYYNAWSLCWHPDYDYYEGWVVDKHLGIPLEHAFCIRKGDVIDSTLGIPIKIAKKQMKKMYPTYDTSFMKEQKFGDEYFGVKIPMAFVNAEYVNSKVSMAVLYAYYNKSKHTGFRRKKLNTKMVTK